MTDGPPGHLLTVREAARLLRVSTATVYKLCARGELVHVRVVKCHPDPVRGGGPTPSAVPWRQAVTGTEYRLY